VEQLVQSLPVLGFEPQRDAGGAARSCRIGRSRMARW
jgi:hypothetical protein